MRLEILGSGGAVTTPRPGCSCAVCIEARERGVPHVRTGPSFFLHGPEIVERPGARRVVLAHVEEIDGLSHDRLRELGRRHGVELAYDTMLLEV